jgi:hypothetical protein
MHKSKSSEKFLDSGNTLEKLMIAALTEAPAAYHLAHAQKAIHDKQVVCYSPNLPHS